MRKRKGRSEGMLAVLIVGQGPPTSGGIPTFIAGLLGDPWLAERAHLEFLNTTPKRAKRPGAATASNLLQAVGHAWSVFRRARKVDVVHLNLAPAPTLPLLRALVLSLAARAGGARVLLHAHTGRLQTVAASSGPYRFFLRQTLRVVDQLIVVSKPAEAAARALCTNVVRLENGVDPSAFATGPKAEPPILAFVGTVCERKGLVDLRDALLIVRTESGGSLPFDVQIVGDATQEGPGVFERVVSAYREAGLSEVRFLGSIPHVDVAAVLSTASVFCLPSHWEGFPLSILEAMAAGCAIVASNVGDISEILAEGHAGILVESKDVRALASAITRLARDAEERTRLGAIARERVEREYSQATVVRRLLALYAGVSLPLE